MPIRQEGLPAFCRRSADQPYLVSPEKIFKQKKKYFYYHRKLFKQYFIIPEKDTYVRFV
jgi:hypothetical protein